MRSTNYGVDMMKLLRAIADGQVHRQAGKRVGAYPSFLLDGREVGLTMRKLNAEWLVTYDGTSEATLTREGRAVLEAQPIAEH